VDDVDGVDVVDVAYKMAPKAHDVVLFCILFTEFPSEFRIPDSEFSPGS